MSVRLDNETHVDSNVFGHSTVTFIKLGTQTHSSKDFYTGPSRTVSSGKSNPIPFGLY
jgi:hypothetical protein